MPIQYIIQVQTAIFKTGNQYQPTKKSCVVWYCDVILIVDLSNDLQSHYEIYVIINIINIYIYIYIKMNKSDKTNKNNISLDLLAF